MFKGAVCAGAALVCWVAVMVAVPGRAQDRPPPPPPPPPAKGQPTQGQRTESRYENREPQAYRVKNVLGSKVSIQGNLTIGSVDDIVFSDDGYVDYLVVQNEGKYVMVPWQAAKFNFDQKTATVNITQTQFQRVPTFTMQQWPNVYAPGYRDTIYGYYNIRPGQERRIERRDKGKGP